MTCSPKRRRRSFGFSEIGRAELIRYFTLTPADEVFVRKFRGRANVLGAAVQLCTLPWLGFVPDEVRLAPAAAVERLSERPGIAVGELRGYGAREQTRTEHLREDPERAPDHGAGAARPAASPSRRRVCRIRCASGAPGRPVGGQRPATKTRDAPHRS